MNPFTGDDYNKITKSSLKSNAQNRLISELSKIVILTNTIGWKLEYKGKLIQKEANFESKIKR